MLTVIKIWMVIIRKRYKFYYLDPPIEHKELHVFSNIQGCHAEG